jgi:cell division protein FtsW (lipid II flippase)
VAKRDLFTVAGRRVLGMDLPRARHLAPLLVAWGIEVGVFALEKELGMSLLVFGAVLAMLYVATERVAWLLIGVSLLAGGCVLGYQLFNHVRERVANWIDPFAHYYDVGGGYQIAQALFGLADGGFIGAGLGVGKPELVPVPRATSSSPASERNSVSSEWPLFCWST